MQPADLFIELSKYINPSDASVILLALKSDTLVWNTLQDPQISQTLLREHYPQAVSWSPAALALRALGIKLTAAELAADQMPALDNALRKKALDTFERVLRNGEQIESLAEAGLIALALRERRRKTRTWVGLADELKSLAVRGKSQLAQLWQTPLACLYAMIPDSDALLQSLIDEELHPGMEWVTHVLLSNPIHVDFQVDSLKKILVGYPVGQQVEWLRYLNQLGRKTLLQSLAADLLMENQTGSLMGQDLNFAGMPWKELAEWALLCEAHATLHELAGHPAQAAIELENTRQILHTWLNGATLQLISLSARDGRVKPYLWDESQKIAALQPVNESLQSETFFIAKDSGSNPYLVDSDLTKNLILGKVFQAGKRALSGNRREAQEIAREAINYWIAQVKRSPANLSGNFVFDYQIGPLMNTLVELGLVNEAVEVGQLFASARPEDIDLLVAVADLFHRLGNHEIALNYIYQVILLEPENVEPHRILANYLEQSKSWAEAFEERKKIVELVGGKAIEDQLSLAQCALGGKFFEEAIRVCERLIDLEPGLGMAWTYLGMAHAGEGRLDDALAFLSKATLLNPENSLAWAQLADLHKRNGDLQRCMETLRSAILTAPDSAELHYALGKAYLEARSPSEALPFLRQSARLAPESDSVALALVETLFSLGHEQEALMVIEKARQRWPVDAGLAYQHARILLSRGERDEGLATLEVALQSVTPQPEWFVQYASALIGPAENIWGQMTLMPEYAVIAKAQRALQKALNIAPDHFEARLMLAEILALRQEPEAAFAAYHHLIDLADAGLPKFYWRIQAGLGFVASRLGHIETALASYQNAAGARPELVSIQRALAEAYLSAALKESAMTAAEEALSLAPDKVANLIWYADLMERVGQSGKAADALHTAMELDATNVNLVIRLANLLINSQSASEAENALLQAISMENVNVSDLREIAAAAKRLGNDSLALNALEKAVMITEKPSDDLQYDLARLYQQKADYEKALAAIQSALSINDQNVAYYLLQADLQEATQRPQAALAALEHGLRLQESASAKTPVVASDLLDLHIRFARLLEKTGNLNSALYHAEKALEFNESSQEIQCMAVDLAERLLQWEHAAQLIKNATEIGPTASHEEKIKHAEMVGFQAWQLLTKGDFDHAEAQLEQGLQFDGTNLRLMAGRIFLLTQQGRTEEAQKLLDERYSLLQDEIDQPDANLSSDILMLAEAASEAFEWTAALQMFTAYYDRHPGEPLAQLSYARALVRAAEWQLVARDLDVENHLAQHDLIKSEVYVRFDQVIQDLKKAGFAGEGEHWRNRGEFIFQTASNRLVALDTHTITEEDAPWTAVMFSKTGAIKNIYPLVDKYPSNPLLLGLAAWSIGDQDPNKAYAWAKKAVTMTPNHPILQAILATRANQAEDYADAYEAQLAAVNLWPDEAKWQYLAGVYARKCQEKEASVIHLQKAVEIAARKNLYIYSLAEAYLSIHQPKPAIDTLNSLVHIEPENASAWQLLAQAYAKDGQMKPAYSAAEQTLRVNPKSVAALVLCGEISLQYNPAKSLEFVRQAQALAPDDPNCRLLAAKILVHRGKDKEALAELTQSINEIPDSVDLNLDRARLIYKLESPAAAIPVLKSLMIQFPEDDRVAAFAAQVFAETGNLNQAEKAAQAALKIDANLPEMQYLLGKVYHETGQLDKSIYHLSEAVMHGSQPLEALLEIGKAFSDRREFHKALAAYQKAIEVDENDYRAYYLAAMVMRDGKDYPGAENMLRKAAQLNPDDVNIRRQLGAIVALNLVQTCQEANSCQ
jgi:tetratricopeptide (TPR) repeat protein